MQTGAFIPLEHLNLGWNYIEDAGVQALAASPFKRLNHLLLDRNWIGDAGAKALAASKTSQTFVTFICMITSTTVKANVC